MNMVGHQTPSEHVDTGVPTPLSDEFDVPAIVGLAEKRLLPPISTLGHVMGDTWDDNASCAWHGSTNGTAVRNIARTFARSGRSNNWNCPQLNDDPSPFDEPAPEGSAQTVSQVLGEIVWLMSQSPMHKQFVVADLEWLVMTPVILQQFRIFYQDAPPEQGGRRPIGVILWGTVSPEVDAMLTQGTNRLRPQDWKSGDKAWVVEVIAPFGGGDAMVADLKAKVFAGRELRALVMTDGRREVRRI